MQAVGRDHQGCLVDPAVRETDARPGLRVLVVDHMLVGQQFHARALHARRKMPWRSLRWMTITGNLPALQIPQVEAGQLASVERIAHDHVLGQDPQLLRLVQEPVLVQVPGVVGGDLDSAPTSPNSLARSRTRTRRPGRARANAADRPPMPPRRRSRRARARQTVTMAIISSPGFHPTAAVDAAGSEPGLAIVAPQALDPATTACCPQRGSAAAGRASGGLRASFHVGAAEPQGLEDRRVALAEQVEGAIVASWWPGLGMGRERLRCRHH